VRTTPRSIDAVALADLSSEELSRAAASVEVETDRFARALLLLESAMRSERVSAGA
jgi:hypothetical protein